MSKHAPYGGVGQATRYCGKTTIRCRFNDAYSAYECNLSVNGKRRGKETVRLPPAWASMPEYEDGVDSPRAFDGAAQAAVAFAFDRIDENDVEYDEDLAAFKIRRKK